MSDAVLLHPGGPLRGEVAVPGDKSVSHRAFLVNALGGGRARVRGANPGRDVEATRRVLRDLGVTVLEEEGGFVLRGRGGRLRTPTRALDCGNSGTTLRLGAGLAAAQPFTTTLDGDASLRCRPMLRIARPLRRLGATVDGPDAGRTPPLIVTGGRLHGGRFDLPVASAQVKSCILLAAAAAKVAVEVREPGASRDHTERMLVAMGASLEHGPGWTRLDVGARLDCVDVDVPGDPSAAALLAAAAVVVPGSRIRVASVLLNPGRIAFLEVLEEMGASVHRVPTGTTAGEPHGALEIEAAPLRGVVVAARRIPALIDEIPALAVAAAFAEGVTRFAGVGELRVKESDRMRAVRELLAAGGVEAWEEGDDLLVRGGSPRVADRLTPARDHRMVMAAGALAHGALAAAGEGTCAVVGADEASVSFPGFFSSLAAVGGRP